MDKETFIQHAAIAFVCRPYKTDAARQFQYPSHSVAIAMAEDLWRSLDERRLEVEKPGVDLMGVPPGAMQDQAFDALLSWRRGRPITDRESEAFRAGYQMGSNRG